jgi:tryptophan-rich sensory protein
MKFNFIVIPLVIIATAYLGSRYTKKGLKNWYGNLKKPSWTPDGKTIGEIWTFLYLLTGFAILWFWNVPKFGWWHYVVGGVLIVNAFLNLYWNKIFFVEHNFSKALKWMKALNITSVIAAVIIFPFSNISAIAFLPYIIWVGVATKLTKEIWKLNKN